MAILVGALVGFTLATWIGGIWQLVKDIETAFKSGNALPVLALFAGWVAIPLILVALWLG